MIFLSDEPPKPQRVALEQDAWIEVRPCTAIEFYAARERAQPLIAAFLLGSRSRDEIVAVLGAEFGEPGAEDDPALAAAALERLALIEIVTQCASAWHGIGDADGQPAELNRVNIARLLRMPSYAQAISVAVNRPIYERRAEGNAFAASPSGAAAADKITAPNADHSAPIVPPDAGDRAESTATKSPTLQ